MSERPCRHGRTKPHYYRQPNQVARLVCDGQWHPLRNALTGEEMSEERTIRRGQQEMR